MPRKRQGHSTSENVSADERAKKTGEVFVTNSHDTGKRPSAHTCQVKTMPTSTVSNNLIKNGTVESVRTVVKGKEPNISCSTSNKNQCDMKTEKKSCNAHNNNNRSTINNNILTAHHVPSVTASKSLIKSGFMNNVNTVVSSAFGDKKLLDNFVNCPENTSITPCGNVNSNIQDSAKRNVAIMNGDIEKFSSELNSQTSGLLPEVSSSLSSSLETHPSNYRLSTTIMETKTSLANETSGESLIQRSQLVDNQKNCPLPSSVYGSASSNIEKVLTGLQFAESKDSLENQNELKKNSALQKINREVLEKDIVTATSGVKNNVITRNTNFCWLNVHNANSKDLENSGYVPSENNSREEHCQSNLKIHIPEVLSPEESESLLQTSTENQKVAKFPKITSPQILEQHISKIISENAAIVETLDPLWSKRYLRQSSLTSSQNADSETRKTNLSNRLRRVSEDKANLSTSVDLSQSKLQSALLGTLEPKHLVCIQDAVGTTYVPFPSPINSTTISSQSVPINTVPKISSVSEEELKGSAVKSLLSLKQGRFSEKNLFYFNKEKFDQHPQNPEGSIIKDLLLKTKSKTKFGICSDNENSGLNQNELSHLCTCCGLSFLSQGILEAHKAVCKGVKSSIISPTVLDIKASNVPVSKVQSGDKVQLSFPILNPLALSNSIEVLLKNENSCDDSNEGMGPILKKQLLSPVSSKKEPVIKKRKMSEPVFSTNKITFDRQKVESFIDFDKSIALSKPDENLTLSSHRCRSQSVHLFGGEVQILDGVVTKKIKISTSLSDAISSTTNTVLNSSSYAKSSLYEEQTSKDSTTPLPTIIVTIAQPVHNSGGTVTHIPSRKLSSPFSPIMTLPNNILPNKVEKHFDFSSPTKNKDTFPLLSTSVCTVTSSLTKMSSEMSVIQKFPKAVTKTLSVLENNATSFSPTKVIKAVTPIAFMPTRELLVSSISPTPRQNLCSSPRKSPLAFKSACNIVSPEKLKTVIPEKAVSGKQAISEFSIFQSAISGSNSPNPLKSSIPTVLLTPSSPTRTEAHEDRHDSDEETVNKNRKFLAPTRPNSLPLKKKPFTMVGSTLISPETPRPKKTCVQLYINGHAYTYLGLKCSTRSTYCCIYRPQPMFVLQDTDPKLSMYSNWQVVPSKEELAGMTPGQMMAFYNSKQSPFESDQIFTTARTGELLSFTHSSYWTFRSQERDKTDSLLPSTEKSVLDYSTTMDLGSSDNALSAFPKNSYESNVSNSTFCSESTKVNKRDGCSSSVSDNTSSLDVEASLSDADINNSQDEEDDDDDDDDRAEVLTDSSQSHAPKRVKIFEGGFKSNEEYIYVRGRGRGKYVCEECGIRCKKPSMLKKHIRTHTDLRPYKCRHCSFAFKTKGNLTKHMKSKAHHKKCTELGIIPVPTTTDDSQVDEAALAKQEQLKKRNLPFSDGESPDEDDDDDDEQDDDLEDSDGLEEDYESDSSSCIMSTNTNKLANGHSRDSDSVSVASGVMTDLVTVATQESILQRTVEQEAARSLLHLSSLNDLPSQWPTSSGESLNMVTCVDMGSNLCETVSVSESAISSLSATSGLLSSTVLHKVTEPSSFLAVLDEPIGHRPRSYSADIPYGNGREQLIRQQQSARAAYTVLENASTKESESGARDMNTRRYSISVAREARKSRAQALHWGTGTSSNVLLQKWPEIETAEQPMDLRVSRSDIAVAGKLDYETARNIIAVAAPEDTVNVLNSEIYLNDSFALKPLTVLSPQLLNEYESIGDNNSNNSFHATPSLTDPQQCSVSSNVTQSPVFYSTEGASGSTTMTRKESDPMEDLPSPEVHEYSICSPVSPPSLDDNCYSQESATPSSSVVELPLPQPRFQSDFLKPGTSNMEEGKCVCRICNKIFAKAGQLRIHVNIHYFERPFRCDNCGVSFRTKGHLQKHKRSVSHYNKVNMNMTFGTPSIDNPRPFKCADCKIAFRIHGHLAKHLRSKMHIMKLECLGKLPFGMYAEMERSGVSLNEIDTTDCNNSLESLQVMAQKLYQRDPRRMRWHSSTLPNSDLETSKCPTSSSNTVDSVISVPDQLITTHTSPSAIAVPIPSTVNLNIPVTSSVDDVKREPSEQLTFASNSSFPETDVPVRTSTVFFVNQNPIVTTPQPQTRAEGADVEPNTALHRSDTCHICGRMFKSTKFLQVHLYCDHSSWNPPAGDTPTTSVAITDSSSCSSGTVAVAGQELGCDLCGKHFSNQSSLQQHLLTHAQPRPFVCEVCDAGFTSSSSLVAHLATHQQINSPSAASTETNLLQLQ